MAFGAARMAFLAGTVLLASACAEQAAPVRGKADIVSLNPCVDAILAEIAPERLASISHYSHDPDSSSMDVALAARFPANSGSAEEIAAFAPRLVIAGSFLPPATEGALGRMGIAVHKTGSIASIADARAQVRELAAMVGAVSAGERLIARIDAAVDKAAPRPGTAAQPALVWQSGGIVPGEGTLISDMMTHAGFANWSAGRGLGQGAALGLEEVLADPPPLIIAAGGTDTGILRHGALNALPDTRRAEFAPNLLYCGGPTIPRAMRRLTEIRASTTAGDGK